MLVKRIYLTLFMIFLVAAPIYVFESGLPQPADFLMAFLILVLATGFIVKPPIHSDLMLFGALFLGYVAVVSLFWWTQYQTQPMLLSPIYYVYNFGAMMVTLSLIRTFRERFVVVCHVALAIAIILEVVALLVLSGPGIRALGTFNNPNQLGYWGLLIGICVLVLKQDRRLSMADVALLGGAGFAVVHSLSKAALLSFGLLLVLALVCQGMSRPVRAALLAVGVMGAAIALTDSSLIDRSASQGVIGKVTDRLENIGEQGDDSLSGRGYDRIWRYPEYLVFGAGEGAAWRFSRSRINPHLDQREMHSTLGTVLFSYGVIGFFLFVAMLAMVFRRAPLAHLLYSLPIWAYGMTHQGLRTTMLWIFLGLVFGLAHYVRSPAPQQSVTAPVPPRPARASGRGLRASAVRSAGQWSGSG